MLKLFYSPGACSLAPHIALEEAGATFQTVRVVLAQGEHLTPEYLAINPHARVPALTTGKGTITENIAILNFIADMFGAAGAVPRSDPYVAARCNELLGWFSSSVHISFAQVWRAERFTRDTAMVPAIVAGGRENLEAQFAEIEQHCSGGWLIDDEFSAADSYALIFFRWGKRLEFDMGRYPRWADLCARILERPAVRTVVEHEQLQTDSFAP